MLRRALLLAAISVWFWCAPANAQTPCQYIAPGAILTAAQWNQCFSGKANFPLSTSFSATVPLTATTTATTVVFALNYDSTLALTSGVNLGLNLAHANVWGATQTFPAAVLGAQQSSQGTLTLANTAAGAYSTVIRSSNSATAAATYTLPMAPPTGNGYALTATTGGVMSWAPTTASACNTTPGAIQYDSSGNLGCVAGVTSNGTSMTFAGSDLLLLGSSTGYTAFASANASATNYTATFPATTDTVAELSAIQAFANKTFASSTNTLGGVTMGIGSDSTGDTYYRNSSGILARLGIGTSGQVMTVSGGLPSWGAASTTSPCVTTGNAIQYDASGSFGCVSGATSNGSTIEFSTSALLIGGTSTGTTAIASANASATNYTATLPANSGTLAETNLAQTWSADPTFPNVFLTSLSQTAANYYICLNDVSGALAYNASCGSSDARMKTNWKDAPGLWEVLQIHAGSFDWLDAKQAQREGRTLGFAAQDVEKVMPALVHTGDGPMTIRLADGTERLIDHPKSVDYQKLVVPLVNAVRTLTAICGMLFMLLVISFWHQWILSRRLKSI